MNKNASVFILLSIIALAFFLIAGDRVSNRERYGADILNAVNMQNGGHSSNTSSSKDGAIPASMPTLADVLQELQSQEKSLANQLTDIRSRLEVMNLKTIFTRAIKQGDSGDDVKKLQELLMEAPGIYPPGTDPSDTITGFYGSMTKTAVTEFQSQSGLRQTGAVDQDTKEKLYELAVNAMADESASTRFIDLSTVADLKNLAYLQDQISQSSSAQVNITDLQNQISQLASNLSSMQTDVQANIADLQNQISRPNSGASNYQSASNPAPTSTPPPAFAISNIRSTNVTRTSSTITWVTSNPSTSEADYSLLSDVSGSQKLTQSNAAMITNHTLTIAGLKSGTTYYYYVVSKDGANGVASSSISSFKTPI